MKLIFLFTFSLMVASLAKAESVCVMFIPNGNHEPLDSNKVSLSIDAYNNVSLQATLIYPAIGTDHPNTWDHVRSQPIPFLELASDRAVMIKGTDRTCGHVSGFWAWMTPDFSMDTCFVTIQPLEHGSNVCLEVNF